MAKRLGFSETIRQFAESVPEAVEALRKQSALDVINLMQTPIFKGGRMRVDTGFLRYTGIATTSAPPQIDPNAFPEKGKVYTWDYGSVESVITGATFEQPIYFGYTAAYAGHREFGVNGQPPDAFMRTAEQQWDGITAKNWVKVKAAFDL